MMPRCETCGGKLVASLCQTSWKHLPTDAPKPETQAGSESCGGPHRTRNCILPLGHAGSHEPEPIKQAGSAERFRELIGRCYAESGQYEATRVLRNELRLFADALAETESRMQALLADWKEASDEYAALLKRAEAAEWLHKKHCFEGPLVNGEHEWCGRQR